ncbi:hypothetical protein GCM10023082_66290 [Streptomyces tremellae]|uniref:Uncharacterized protein n=1 Tax=Streptomyces tremellae TaxID=1124239 RepID=A0ABP7GL72_9ACTN
MRQFFSVIDIGAQMAQARNSTRGGPAGRSGRGGDDSVAGVNRPCPRAAPHAASDRLPPVATDLGTARLPREGGAGGRRAVRGYVS